MNPEVTQIDGTLIADGSLMNGVLESGDMIPKVWLTDTAGDLKHPLTINGRLLTYNTRGGSLQNNNNLLQMNQSNPKCVSRTT